MSPTGRDFMSPTGNVTNWQSPGCERNAIHCFKKHGSSRSSRQKRSLNYTAKITDFGLCCTLDESFTYQAAGRSKKLPIKWLSIEALIDRTFSEKSDIWSFGVLMYEVFSLGKVPYAVMNNDDVLEFLLEGKRLERPEFSSEGLYNIMKKCWKKEVENRPNFGELVEMLYEMLERLNEEYAEFYTTVGAQYNTPL